jgi:hypothetical protein
MNDSIVYYNASNFSSYWLANNGRIVTLYNQTENVSNTTYPDFSGDAEQGKSWTRLENGTYVICEIPTPGFANNCTVAQNQTNVKISMNLSSPAVVNVTYSDIFNISIESKANCSALDNVTLGYNITTNGSLVFADNATVSIGCNGSAGNWTPNATGEYELCGWITNSTANNTNTTDDSKCANITVVGAITDNCDLAISIASPEMLDLGITEKFYYNITVNDSATCSNITHIINLTYQIDDLFGNNLQNLYTQPGTIVCNLTLQGNWTPDAIVGSEAYMIKANITAPGCNDTNSTNNYAERNIIVKGTAPPQSSWINITSVDQGSDNTSNWGEIIGVNVNVSKGNASQYAIYAYVRYANATTKVSEESTVYASTKYTTYKMKIPVALKPNCAGSYPNGTYTLVVEGLGQNATATVQISGTSTSYCQTITTTSSTSSGGGGASCPSLAQTSETTGEDTSFYFVNVPDNVTTGQAFNVTIYIKNNASSSQTFTVYSYVFDGGELLSYGKDTNGGWQAGWEANSKDVPLGPNNDTVVTLVNKVKSDIPPGTYELRVRIKALRDLTKSIDVERSTSSAQEEESISLNETPSNQSQNQTQRRTISHEDPIETIRNVLGNATSGFIASTGELVNIVFEHSPKPDFMLMPRIASRLWEGFIWAIAQIVGS